MYKIGFLKMIVWVTLGLPCSLMAQEEEIQVEESAEVFLDDYSDTFQEQFFEGLKQKGIQNYDKAVNAFLECKQMQPNNDAVSHELAKSYLLNKQYQQAQEYAIEALNSDPTNYWYLHTLLQVLKAEGSTMDMVDDRLPMDHIKMKQNLAQLYFMAGKYEEALTVLKGLKMTDKLNHLEHKIKDSLENLKKPMPQRTGEMPKNNGDSPVSEVDRIKAELEGLMANGQTEKLLGESEEAMALYPLQPFFYYANGHALNEMGKYQEATEVLEASLDYLVNDVPLSNNIYKALGRAYNGLGNVKKANENLNKIKPGQ